LTLSNIALLTSAHRVRWTSVALCLLIPALAQAEQDSVDAGSTPAVASPDASPPNGTPDAGGPGVESTAGPSSTKATLDAGKPSPSTPAEPASAKPAGETGRRKAAIDGLPGSPTTPGPGLSPEAPPTPPAPGGRAPSFGAPTDRDAWVFRWGGRISGWEQVGLGHKATDGYPTQTGALLHTPPLTVGKVPIWAGPGGTMNFQYGNQTIMAFTALEAALTSQEYQNYYRADAGPRIRSAYLAYNPAPLGDVRLRFQLGVFPASYGAPGQWGWGIFGPVLSIHGYGGTATANYDTGPRTQLYFEYGIAAVPEVDEAYVRGTYSDWSENGISTIVHHVHAGISFDNRYFAKLHLAQATGRDMRHWLDGQMLNTTAHDGKMQVAALELRWVNDPWGQLGVTPVYWGFDHALSVHNGIWWGLDWTAGGREMSRKFLGPLSDGTGKILAVSTEYNFSLSRILRHPQTFDGNGRDLRVSLAFLPFWTLDSQDPNYKGGKGYFLGATFEYVMLSWLSTIANVFGENRRMAMADVTAHWQNGRWSSHSATVGIVLHSDWQSQDRLVLAYTRYFYSNFADNNPARPLDRDVLTLGASVAF
jgi:hypothetical protein